MSTWQEGLVTSTGTRARLGPCSLRRVPNPSVKVKETGEGGVCLTPEGAQEICSMHPTPLLTLLPAVVITYPPDQETFIRDP